MFADKVGDALDFFHARIVGISLEVQLRPLATTTAITTGPLTKRTSNVSSVASRETEPAAISAADLTFTVGQQTAASRRSK